MTVESLTLPDGRSLAWERYGAGLDGAELDGAGEPGAGSGQRASAIFLHGTPGGRLSAAGYAARLERFGLIAACPDRPGYGKSTALAGAVRGAGADPLLSFADDLHALWQRVGPGDGSHAVVIGGSAGAAYALAFAAAHPEDVAVVGVFSGISPMTAGDAAGLIPVNRDLYAAANPGEEVGASDERLSDLVARVRTSIVAGELIGPPDLAIRDALEPGYAGMEADYAAVFSPGWAFEPGAVRAKVVWCHGGADTNAPIAAARRFAELLPDCEFHTSEGGGHRPDGETLDFLFERLADLKGSQPLRDAR